VAGAALEGALNLIAGLGGGVVERCPEPAGSVPAGFLFNGSLSAHEQLGFTRDRMIGKHRWVVTRFVESTRPEITPRPRAGRRPHHEVDVATLEDMRD
jgi:hypothetical protein